ncbi:DUF397 domain-containing protein [Kineosporia mesophila]|uniref:DUF397 domain-containing protein n=1 Tax=Kineosporia mesophila TaxID=566012 RepID=UPI0038B29E35
MCDSPAENVRWQKASASGLNGCLQIGRVDPGRLAMRDSKLPNSGLILCSEAAWREFLRGSRCGEFDRLSAPD